MRKRDGDVLERRASWNATGIIIASAPMFLTNADRIVTVVTSSTTWPCTDAIVRRDFAKSGFYDARALDGGADDERARDDDHDIVAETRERGLVRHDAHEHGREKRQHGDEIVAQPAQREDRHHSGEHGKRERLIQRHCMRPTEPRLSRRPARTLRSPPQNTEFRYTLSPSLWSENR